jgi:hypothetical protein
MSVLLDESSLALLDESLADIYDESGGAMTSGPRVQLLPIPLSAGAGGTTWVTSGTAGYDTGSPGGTITAWSTTLGVYIPNPSKQVILAFACGATAAGVVQVLVGKTVGTTGQVLPATIETYTISASSSGYLGPWDTATYNQSNPTGVTYTGGINTTALVSGAQGCVVIDFTTTTTLAVRAYGLY